MKIRIFGVALLLLSTLSLSSVAYAQNAAMPMTFRVSGQVTNPTTFNLSKLEKLPVATQNVTYFAAGERDLFCRRSSHVT